MIQAVHTSSFDIIVTLLENGADWEVVVDGHRFSDELKTLDSAQYRLGEDRNRLKAVHEWLRKNGG